MTSARADALPIASSPETLEAGLSDMFNALGHELRLAIIFELWKAYEPHEDDHGLAFSDLRDRVGRYDQSNFDYHLREVVDRFVARSGNGYELTARGLALVQTLISGAMRDLSIGPADIERSCPFCEGSTGIVYRDRKLFHVCYDCEGGFVDPEGPDGMLEASTLPSAGLLARTADEIYTAAKFKLDQAVRSKAAGMCPRCSGVVDHRVTVCDEHQAEPMGPCERCGQPTSVRIHFACTTCKDQGTTSPIYLTRFHPTVQRFFHRHGMTSGPWLNDPDRLRDHQRVAKTLDHELAVRSTDPLRVHVIRRTDDDEVEAVMDEELNIVEVMERDRTDT